MFTCQFYLVCSHSINDLVFQLKITMSLKDISYKCNQVSNANQSNYFDSLILLKWILCIFSNLILFFHFKNKNPQKLFEYTVPSLKLQKESLDCIIVLNSGSPILVIAFPVTKHFICSNLQELFLKCCINRAILHFTFIMFQQWDLLFSGNLLCIKK